MNNILKDKKDYLKVHVTIVQRMIKLHGTCKPYIIFLKLKASTSHCKFNDYKNLYKELSVSRNTFKKYLTILEQMNLIEIKDNKLILRSYDSVYKKLNWKCNKSNVKYINDGNIKYLNTVINSLIIDNCTKYCNKLKDSNYNELFKHVANAASMRFSSKMEEEFYKLNLSSKQNMLIRTLYVLKKKGILDLEITTKDNRYIKKITKKVPVMELIEKVKEESKSLNSASTFYIAKQLGKKSISSVTRISKMSSDLSVMTVSSNRVLTKITMMEVEMRKELNTPLPSQYFVDKQTNKVFKRLPNSYTLSLAKVFSFSSECTLN